MNALEIRFKIPFLASGRMMPTLDLMTLAEKQQQLIEDYNVIPDPQERLAAIVDQARRTAPLPETERNETNRVRGCISLAWVVAEFRDGRCYFKTDADSPLVRGLLALLSRFYSDAPPEEIVATEPAFIEALGLDRNLSPTRLNGLRSVRARIRDLAVARAASGSE